MGAAMSDDRRRQKPVTIEWAYDKVGRLIIDGELWAAVEWSEKRQAWCIEDAEGRCLRHQAHIRGQAAAKDAAIALAETMIRDGRMPLPQDARKQRQERLERQRNTPSAKRRREQRREQQERLSRAWSAKHKAQREDEQQPPLYEAIADAFDLANPDLWKSNAFASLRPRLIVFVKAAIAKLEADEAYAASRPGRFKHQREEQARIQARLVRAREILAHLETEIAAVAEHGRTR
jgi:hypothetical protein